MRHSHKTHTLFKYAGSVYWEIRIARIESENNAKISMCRDVHGIWKVRVACTWVWNANMKLAEYEYLFESRENILLHLTCLFLTYYMSFSYILHVVFLYLTSRFSYILHILHVVFVYLKCRFVIYYISFSYILHVVFVYRTCRFRTSYISFSYTCITCRFRIYNMSFSYILNVVFVYLQLFRCYGQSVPVFTKLSLDGNVRFRCIRLSNFSRSCKI